MLMLNSSKMKCDYKLYTLRPQKIYVFRVTCSKNWSRQVGFCFYLFFINFFCSTQRVYGTLKQSLAKF